MNHATPRKNCSTRQPPQKILKNDLSCAERRRGNTGNTGSDDRCKSFFFLIHCSFYLFCRSSRLPTTIMVPCPLFAGSTNQIQLPLLCLSLFMFILFLYSCQTIINNLISIALLPLLPLHVSVPVNPVPSTPLPHLFLYIGFGFVHRNPAAMQTFERSKRKEVVRQST